MTDTLAIIGVPSSAGAYSPGQEKAPKALRETGKQGVNNIAEPEAK